MNNEAQSLQRPGVAAQPVAAATPARARVLVIDDSVTILKVVSIILAGHGYQVALARDGAEGFEQLRQNGPFDLVLLDFVMPRMNGYQFCRQLRADAEHRELPVVLMSARTNAIGDRFVEQTGAVDALGKPFDARALVAVVGNVLAKKNEDHRRSVPSPEAMVDEEELSNDPALEGPPSRHYRSLDRMSSVIVEALAPTISRMRPHDMQQPAIVESTIARCLTPQLLMELVEAGDDLEMVQENREIMRGDLGLMPLAEILQLFQLRRQTGVMVVTDKGHKHSVTLYIKGGMLDMAQSVGTDDEFRLGRYFVEPGWLTRDEVEKAARRQPANTLFGEFLLEQGMIQPAQLAHALAKQSAELTYEVLRWPEGRFILRQEDELADAVHKAQLALGLSELVLEGFRRVDEWRLMADTIDFEAVLVVDQVALGTLDDSKIGLFERSVIMAINGKRTAREVMEACDLASFDAIKAIYGFLQSRIVREIKPGARRESAAKLAMGSDESFEGTDPALRRRADSSFPSAPKDA
jgi:CheY-like chemotaxis protein